MYRHELLIIDMLANANWERPIYMSMTVGTSNYPAVLQNFFVHEGLAYRITPFNWKEVGEYDGENGYPVDVERFYNNIMNRFKWGEVKESKDYYADETVRRMIYTHRNLITMLVQIMLKNGEPDEKVFNVLEKWYEVFPGEIIPYDAVRDNSIGIAAAYKILHDRAKDKDKAAVMKERYTAIASAIAKDQLEYIGWYNGLRAAQRNEPLIYTRLNTFTQALSILGMDGIDNVPVDSFATEIAKSIEVECNSITGTKSKVINNNAAVDRKLQLIDYLYDILDGFAEVPAIDKKLESTLKFICNHENRMLKRYNVNRLGKKESEEVFASLRIIGSAFRIAEKLNNCQESTLREIKGIYDANVEKYAPYVLNY